MRLKSKREQLADSIAVLPPRERLRVLMFPLKAIAALRERRDEVDALLAPHIGQLEEQRREQRQKRARQRKCGRKRLAKRDRRRLERGDRARLKRAAKALGLVLVLALFTGCAGVTAEDLAPHVATARDLAGRNNAAIATHCVGMPVDDRQALIRDNIDHAAQLGALQQSAGDGPGWLSQVIAWALSFSRLAGIVASDPPLDEPEQPAMDGNDGNAATDPETPTPDDDGDGAADALEPRCCPGCGRTIAPGATPAIMAGRAWHLSCARSDYASQLIDVSPRAMRAALYPDD